MPILARCRSPSRWPPCRSISRDHARGASVMRAAEMYYLEQHDHGRNRRDHRAARGRRCRGWSAKPSTSGLVEIMVHRQGGPPPRWSGSSPSATASTSPSLRRRRERHRQRQAPPRRRPGRSSAARQPRAGPDDRGRLGSHRLDVGAQPVAGRGAGGTDHPDERGGQHLLLRGGVRIGHAGPLRGRVRCARSPLPGACLLRHSGGARGGVGREQPCSACCGCKQRANVAVFSVSALGGRVPGHLYRAGYLQRDDLPTLARSAASSANSARCSCAPTAPAIPSC